MSTSLEREPWELSGALADFAEDGDYDLVREIIDVFMNDTREKMRSLRNAILEPDMGLAQRIAHSLKGASRQLGLLRLAEAAERLESVPAGADAETLMSLLLAIVEQWDEARESVIETRDALPAAGSDGRAE